MAVRDPLEDESLTLSSSASDPACDAVVGYLEDIIMDERRYFEEQLSEQILGFNVAAFRSLQHHKDEVADVHCMLLTLTDFLSFKQSEDYRALKEGRGLDLSNCLMVALLCKSSSIRVSQKDSQP
uniref:ADP-ribosylation factor-like protein 2-binding protein n=1 Tax=Neovison vison TaxID=452646 RepID=A0A8C7BZB6_NEOVI